MELNLTGKKVLVTGSSKGIGLGIAKAFFSEGAEVLCNGRGEGPKELGKATFVKADVTTSDGVTKLTSAIDSVFQGQLDVLICNVGSGSSVPPGKETFEDWKKSFEINFFATTRVIEGLRSKLSSQGNIICISSICGQEQLGAPLTYSAAKAALNSYVVGLSKVLGKSGQRINAIAPGNILFEGSVWEKKMKENSGMVNSMLEKEVALGKLGNVEDVAQAALFLSSDRARFITGAIVVVDGGQVRSW